MLPNQTLLSSLLLEPWLIDAAYAELMLSVVIDMLEGKTNHSQNPDFKHEKPLPSLLCSDHRIAHLSVGSDYGLSAFGSAPEGSSAIIPIRGAITKYDTYYSYGVESIMQWIDAAEQSNSVEEIIFLIDSQGGQANCAFMLAQRIRGIKKRTLAYVDAGTCQSAAYLIAAAADALWVNTPVDTIGSIGAMISLSDYIEKLAGTKTYEIYSRLSTEKNLAFRKLRKENDTSLYEDLLDENVGYFIAAIQEFRGDRLISSEGDPFKGATYSAGLGLKMGLIDGIGPLNLALSELRKTPKIQSTPISFYTQQPKQNDNTDMSFIADLIALLKNHPEVKAEGIGTPAPVLQAEPVVQATATPAPAAPAAPAPELAAPAPTEAPAPTLEARLAALEAGSIAKTAQLQAENTRLATLLAAKPSAEATALLVSNETVPQPVTIEPVTSFRCETDEIAAQLRSGIAE